MEDQPGKVAMGEETLTVYSKPGCVQCDATYRALRKFDLPYEVVDVERTPGIANELRYRGFASLPVVDAPGEPAWSGFQPGRIKNVAASRELAGRSDGVQRGARSAGGADPPPIQAPESRKVL